MVRLRTVKICAALAVIVLNCLVNLASATAQNGVFKVQVVADDMCCKGCAQKIAAQLYAAPGVTSVEADVPKRLVTVTAKPSPKLTLERIWLAVEQGKGGPSKLVTSQVTYALMKPVSLQPAERMAAGRYALVVRDMRDKDRAQAIANQLYAVRGATSVGVGLDENTLFVEAAGVELSPWTLVAAVERSKHQLAAVNGPQGMFTIERSSAAKQDSAAPSTHSQF